MLRKALDRFKKDDNLSLKQSETGEWMVKRKLKVVYMGSKDKCLMYLAHLKKTYKNEA